MLLINLFVSTIVTLSFTNASSMPQEGTTMVKDGDSRIAAEKTPFPKWLSEFTGMSEWPGLNPPYIPLDFIDMGEIPDYEPYKQGECTTNPRLSCSFDCHGCVEPDDVFTCSKLSQTFDDGPSLVTEELLEALTHKITFFNLGINIVNNPSAYKKTIEKGHLIGTHTWSHPFLPSLTNEEIIAQLEWSIWAMNATGNHIPKWFRPPYGGIDNRVRAITRQFGLQAALWDFDTFDWQLGALDSPFPIRTEEDVYDDVKRWKTANKGLILEHDGSPRTINVGININRIIGDDQLTVAQCAGGIDYIRQYHEKH